MQKELVIVLTTAHRGNHKNRHKVNGIHKSVMQNLLHFEGWTCVIDQQQK